MAAVTKTGTPTVCTPDPPMSSRISGLLAGEDIAAGDACYLKSSDNKVWLGNGTQDETALVAGFAGMAADAGFAVTLYTLVNFAYGPKVGGVAMAAGIPLYLSAATPGALANVASAAGTVPIAYTLGDGRIYVVSNYSSGSLPTTVA